MTSRWNRCSTEISSKVKGHRLSFLRFQVHLRRREACRTLDSRYPARSTGSMEAAGSRGKSAKRIAQNLGGNAEQQAAAGKNVEVRKSLQKWSNQTFAGLAVAILRTIRCWKVLLLQPQDGSSMD